MADPAIFPPSEDEMNRLIAPPINRAMRVLDKNFFQKTIPTSGAVINNLMRMSAFKKECKDFIIFPKTGIVPVKTVQGLENPLPISKQEANRLEEEAKSSTAEDKPTIRKLLPLVPSIKYNDPSTYPPTIKKFLQNKDVELIPYDYKMTFDDWTYDQIMEAILPEDCGDDIPHGYTHFGHIAHMNIREKWLPYKHIIAELILDKNRSRIRTVINKIDEVGVSSEFRTFGMEILAGEPDTIVETVENGCRFKFDFAKVYWNSRLENEHGRLISSFKPGEAVADVMAGVGPFAVPAAKKKVFVWANDLNPDSYSSMVGNIKTNKVNDFAFPHNQDGRDFIRQAVRDLYRLSKSEWGTVSVPQKIKFSRSNPIPPEQIPPPTKYQVPPVFSHFVMNLPASAVEFLDAYIGVYRGMETLFTPYTKTLLPMIHVHIFEKPDEETPEKVCARISKYLNYRMLPQEVNLHSVRLVAPNKRMYCASFRLPSEVAFAGEEGRAGMETEKEIPGLEYKAWIS